MIAGAALLLATPDSGTSAGPLQDCRYVEAGPPGPRGNRLVIVDEFSQAVFLYRDGERIQVRRIPCSGPQATTRNIDRIVIRAEADEGVIVDQRNGRFAPGATRERTGSEIEMTLDTRRIEVVGTDRSDAIRVRTLADQRVALNLNLRADARRPDYDVLLARIPRVLRLNGGDGADTLDTRLLTGMGDPSLRRVIALDAGPGDDRILGGPGGEWRIKDGPGDDFVASGPGADSVDLGRGRDTVYAGPGNDDVIYEAHYPGSRRQPVDALDRIFGGPGPDQIIDLNGRPDRIRCGPGRDEVQVDSYDRPAADCERLR